MAGPYSSESGAEKRSRDVSPRKSVRNGASYTANHHGMYEEKPGMFLRFLSFLIFAVLAVALLYGPHQLDLGAVAPTGEELAKPSVGEFCELRGVLDDCKCNMTSVDSLNNELSGTMDKLLEHEFFHWYKVDLYKGCDVWPDDGMCANEGCAVKECEQPTWLQDGERTVRLDPDCEGLDVVDKDATERNQARLDRMDKHDLKKLEDYLFCAPDAYESPEAEYFNLYDNPERFTGYGGEHAARIWGAIYKENCFYPEGAKFLTSKTIKDLCAEKRIFYRIVSGLHASINVDVAYNFLHPDKTWGPSLDFFIRRFHPEFTWGEGPTWIKNLYFAYTFMLRGITKAQEALLRYDYFTGDEDTQQPAAIRKLIGEMTTITSTCPELFDETALFTGDDHEELMLEFRDHFRNVTRIMDCVGCDKCRLWAKVQVQGLATSMRVLFAEHPTEVVIDRNEIVAMFQTLGRLSHSMKAIDDFRGMLRQQGDEVYEQMKSPQVGSFSEGKQVEAGRPKGGNDGVGDATKKVPFI
eukprot:Clim_evm1s188 gene=Clim_evmTU1s188